MSQKTRRLKNTVQYRLGSLWRFAAFIRQLVFLFMNFDPITFKKSLSHGIVYYIIYIVHVCYKYWKDEQQFKIKWFPVSLDYDVSYDNQDHLETSGFYCKPDTVNKILN